MTVHEGKQSPTNTLQWLSVQGMQKGKGTSMNKSTMNRHIVAALKIKAEMEALKAELDKHEDAIKRGIMESGKADYDGGCHKATYRIDQQMRFNKDIFISKYSKQEYEDCKAPSKKTYFKYA